jgi:hypothetical protein
MRQVPARPAATPASLRPVTGSWRVRAAVIRTAKTGVVEFRTAARPASTVRSAQAIRVKGTTLLRQAWTRNRRQVAASRGRAMPRARATARSTVPAIVVRAAIRVSGGIVATPSLMKL